MFYTFWPPQIFLKQLPIHIPYIAKAPQANPKTIAFSKGAILPIPD